MTELTQERVRQLFTYNEATGKLHWNERPESDFATKNAWAVWNARQAGSVAGGPGAGGYWFIKIDGKTYTAHRLVWLYVNGDWPEGDLDHEYGVTGDNRISRLRLVSHAQNQKNQKRPSTNKSGVVGVHWGAQIGKWRAEIQVDGRKIHLGCFDDFDKAVVRRKAAEREYGFHEQHGRAA